MLEVINLFSTPASTVSTSTPLYCETRDTVNDLKSFQAVVAGTGAVSAVVNIEVSNNGVDWLVLSTLSLSGTTRATDGFVANGPWAQFRGNVTSISGTAATVQVIAGI